jgi:glycosyltransferase involved in cell wall biosynthesis
MVNLVSIIIPCYNEEKTIGTVLDALANQSYPLERLEVLVIDGKSADCTCEKVIEFENCHPRLNVHLVQNPRRVIPVALNIGIAKCRGDFILRMDAHAVPAHDYVEKCVALLQADVADNVGGCWHIAISGKSARAQAIARAVGHPFGIGNALYRYAKRAAYVDTVPFGAFKRSTFNKYGLYDESLLVNEDYDLNYRIRRGGGKVYLSPDINSTYHARESLHALAKQYFRYGWWKIKMLRKYPEAIRWRQVVPPAFVAALIGTGFGSFFTPVFTLLCLGLLSSYLLMCLIVTAHVIVRRKCSPLIGVWLPIVFIAIHLTWGSGFWASLLNELLMAVKACALHLAVVRRGL